MFLFRNLNFEKNNKKKYTMMYWRKKLLNQTQVSDYGR